jgi:hypothetical protein
VRIKKLLHEQGFTIAGARAVLKNDGKPARSQSALFAPARNNHKELKQVRAGLQEILQLLGKSKKK